jgi:hypothetical protein
MLTTNKKTAVTIAVARKAFAHTDRRRHPQRQMQQKHPAGQVNATLTALARPSEKLTPTAAGNWMMAIYAAATVHIHHSAPRA